MQGSGESRLKLRLGVLDDCVWLVAEARIAGALLAVPSPSGSSHSAGPLPGSRV